jgi:hypothetical protein
MSAILPCPQGKNAIIGGIAAGSNSLFALRVDEAGGGARPSGDWARNAFPSASQEAWVTFLATELDVCGFMRYDTVAV